MSRIHGRLFYCTLAGLVLVSSAWLLTGPALTADRSEGGAPVEKMLESLGAQSGLCVHLGVRDGTLATGLSAGGQYLVHGLSTSQDAVDKARGTIASAGLEGVVSVELGSVGQLPYADNLVNLLVVDDLLSLVEQGLNVGEILRVLRPGGVAWLGQPVKNGKRALTEKKLNKILAGAECGDFELVAEDGLWAKIVLPRPEGMDEWTHKRYAATGNPVSKDRQMGVPSGVRWIAGPVWPPGYRKTSVPGVVASKKHLVYIFEDEAQTPEGPVPQNSLIARDPFNGLLLWKQKTTKESSALAVLDDRVYTVLEDLGPLVALDANSGEIVHKYPGSGAPKKVILSDGLLISDLPEGLACFDAASGKLEWEYSANVGSFVAAGGSVYVQSGERAPGGETVSHFACLDLKTGEQQWKEPTAWSEKTPEVILCQAGVVVAAGGDGTHAVSAADGSHLWTYNYPLIGHGGSFTKVLYLDGLVWVHNAGTEENPGYTWEGLDPTTGEVKSSMPHTITTKHRCYADVATERYFLYGTMDFIDTKTKEQQTFTAAKSSCRAAGIMPANGLLYTFPHACGCYSMIRGFMTLESVDDPAGSGGSSAGSRLEAGPASAKAVAAGGPSADDWATYRHDAARRGSTTAPGPANLDNVLWQHEVAGPFPESAAAEWDLKPGGRMTSPVIAGGLAFVAATDAHRLSAFDAKTGAPRWTYTAGGRIDCPPTVSAGLCLFGSRDGWVYCLRADDGRLVWRFRAAPNGRRIVAYGQMESPWPVYGGVLVFDGLAYFVAGRHGRSDGGLFVQAVAVETGEPVWSEVLDYAGVPDVLTGSGETIQIASVKFHAKTGQQGATGPDGLRGGRLGLLSDGWYRRPVALRKSLQTWTAGEGKRGQMLAFNNSTVCSYRAFEEVNGGTGELSGTAELYVVESGGESEQKRWSIEMPHDVRIQGMVLAAERLYVAGLLNDGDSRSNVVRAYSVSNGDLLGEYATIDPVVHDCLAVAGERLYVSTQGGKLICLGEK